MKNIKVISKQIFGECSGSIFIDLVHAASEIILAPDILHDFTCELYRRLYSNEQWESMIICLDDSSYFFNDLNANLMTANPKWFQIYRENDYVFCDQIEIAEEEIKREIFSGWSDTCADIYGTIVKEICSVTREPAPIHDFCNRLFHIWEEKTEDHKDDFYITANLGRIAISDKPQIIDDPSYGLDVEPNHFYHLYRDKSFDMKFVEIELDKDR